MIFHENRLLTDDFLRKLRKTLQNLSPAAVVIGALRVKSLPTGQFCMLLCRLLIFFKNIFLQNILSGIPSECQTD